MTTLRPNHHPRGWHRWLYGREPGRVGSRASVFPGGRLRRLPLLDVVKWAHFGAVIGCCDRLRSRVESSSEGDSEESSSVAPKSESPAGCRRHLKEGHPDSCEGSRTGFVSGSSRSLLTSSSGGGGAGVVPWFRLSIPSDRLDGSS